MAILPIKIDGNRILLAKAYLGSDQCYVWVGFQYEGAKSDVRVWETRALMARWYPKAPYGMFVGNTPPDGDEIVPITDADGDGYYELDTSWWEAGVYRFNYHSPSGVETPHGSKIDVARRDGQVSWALWGKDREATLAVRDFVHEELCGEGKCFRVLIRLDGKIEPFGNNDLVVD